MKNYKIAAAIVMVLLAGPVAHAQFNLENLAGKANGSSRAARLSARVCTATSILGRRPRISSGKWPITARRCLVSILFFL